MIAYQLRINSAKSGGARKVEIYDGARGGAIFQCQPRGRYVNLIANSVRRALRPEMPESTRSDIICPSSADASKKRSKARLCEIAADCTGTR